MRILRLLLIWLTFGATTSCDHRPTPESLAGCYDVQLAGWEPDVDLGGDSLSVALPSRVLLDPAPGPADPDDDFRSMRVAPQALPSVHYSSHWMVTGESVRMVWSTGYTGVSATVRKEGPNLVGEAESFWDDGTETQTSHLILTPVDCGSPPRLTLEDQRPIPASLSLADGRVVRLRETFTAGGGWRQATWGDHIFLRDDVVVPGVGRADSLMVGLSGDAILSSISLYLPPDFDVRSLVDRLAAEIGPPVSDRTSESPDGTPWEWVSWSNRTTGLSIARTRRPGRDWEVTLHLSTQGKV